MIEWLMKRDYFEVCCRKMVLVQDFLNELLLYVSIVAMGKNDAIFPISTRTFPSILEGKFPKRELQPHGSEQ